MITILSTELCRQFSLVALVVAAHCKPIAAVGVCQSSVNLAVHSKLNKNISQPFAKAISQEPATAVFIKLCNVLAAALPVTCEHQVLYNEIIVVF